ncbi:hypothetical protein [Candidatus Methanodesulfokora washburnensis]|jgi:hypothetical protein|uniref:Uncharacterized protein n=1 Tax=Candidatus Methanodesulfokora washburnensis TaxID=2478471 RepID=A0A429GSY0_9CREN|nr:hypothetical protein [Candidatus Methanodesulfokores washburnensis]RSN76879.1 hypothetical protein D6D85_03415 [Candidatus Methanodesulfokores washburnensis]
MAFVRYEDLPPEVIVAGGLLSAYDFYRGAGFSREKIKELLAEKAKKDIKTVGEMRKTKVNPHEVARLLREYASIWLYVAEKLEEEEEK